MHDKHIAQWHHDHAFGQDQKRSGEKRTLIVVGLTLVMMVWEIAAGLVYGSMALLADGLHMGSHATALGIAAFAYAYARKNATNSRFSFGTGKVNALGDSPVPYFWLDSHFFMVIESVDRFVNPVAISFNGAIFVAVIGLIVNGVSAWILGDDHDHSHAHHEDESRSPHHHSHHDHNRQAAYFHVLADALTSLLAIIALLAGKYAGWNWMDPVMGIVGAILITRWSWGLLRTTASVLLDEQQASIVQDIKRTVECDDTRVSDLHVWSIGPHLYAAIVAIVAHYPQSPSHYRERIQTGHSSLVHVTVEVQTCPSHS